MYSCVCRFFPDLEKTSQDEFFRGELSAFLAALYRNGQLLGQPWNMVAREGRIDFAGLAPAPDALDARHHSLGVREALARLRKKSRRAPRFTLVGKVLEAPACCSCPDSASYLLLTHCLAEFPPVRCGDCDRPVPLYRLPFVGQETDYTSLLRWEATYKSCDMLWLQSGVGERFGYRQTSRVDSPLTAEGRRLCGEMAASTGKQFYYYLARYHSPQPETCPACGRAWRLLKRLHDVYSHRCDRCLLITGDSATWCS
jgi:predicted  nucleic acid-binding Zn ribbon protein